MTRNVQDIVLASCVSNLLMLQFALLVVTLVTMVQTVSNSVHKTVWITSVSVMEANVQHVFLENWEAYVTLVSYLAIL